MLYSSPITESRQLVLVITADWEAVAGRLWRYGRADVDAPWHLVGSQSPVVVGRNGMGWGRGLHALPPGEGPTKKEGDGKAPAGVFRLARAFGYAPAAEAAAVKLPYTHLTSNIECVDDARSAHYNTLVDRSEVAAADWNSAERMLRPDERYQWGVIIAHNTNPTIAGAGSCIFLHIWESAAISTAGCTAMEAEHLEQMLGWLDPAANPVLAQLPESEFKRLHQSWGLPKRACPNALE